MAVVPLFAMSGVPVAAHYWISAAVIDEGRARAPRTVNVLSLVLAFAVGALLTFSLLLGSIGEAVGEVVSLAILWRLMSSAKSRMTKLTLAALILGAAALGVVVYLASAALR